MPKDSSRQQWIIILAAARGIEIAVMSSLIMTKPGNILDDNMLVRNQGKQWASADCRCAGRVPYNTGSCSSSEIIYDKRYRCTIMSIALIIYRITIKSRKYDKLLPMGLNSHTIMTKRIYTKSARLQKWYKKYYAWNSNRHTIMSN